MGRDYFEGKALTWLWARFDDYSNVATGGRAAWAKEVAKKFLEHEDFKHYPIKAANGVVPTIGDLQDSIIPRWFSNKLRDRTLAQNRAQVRIGPSASGIADPLSSTQQQTDTKRGPRHFGIAALGYREDPPTARRLFGDDRKLAINKIANSHREALGL
ncbi:hypothetical protein M422DRAFT_30158, partial [Sphaerobolus stellatus SS14]